MLLCSEAMVSLKVVETKSGFWYFGWFLLLLLCFVAVAFLGWQWGVVNKGYFETEIAQLQQNNQELKQQVAELSANSLNLDSREKIAQASVQQVSDDMGELQQKNNLLEKELTFYRSIMAPELDQAGLTIESLELSPVSPQEFDVVITLTQVKKQDWYLKGQLKADIEGEIDGKISKISLQSVVQEENWSNDFSFRYFQKMRARVLLPEGFTPSLIKLMAVTTDKKQKTEREFPWKLTENL